MTEQNLTKSDTLNPDAIDMKIARLLIEAPAITDQEIAEKIGTTRQTVNRRKNGPVVQKIMRSVLSIPEKEMRRLAAKALARLEELLDSDDPRIKLAAAQALAKLNTRILGNALDMGLW